MKRRHLDRKEYCDCSHHRIVVMSTAGVSVLLFTEMGQKSTNTSKKVFGSGVTGWWVRGCRIGVVGQGQSGHQKRRYFSWPN